MYLAAVESFEDRDVVVVVEGLYLVGLKDQDLQGWEVSQHFNRTEMVPSQVKLSQLGELLDRKHILEVLKVALL